MSNLEKLILLNITIHIIYLIDHIMHALSDYETRADSGTTYTELSRVYPSWSTDLHSKGHLLGLEELNTIFTKGLMLWYIKYHCSKFGIYNDKCEYPPSIDSFYEFKMGMSLLRHFDQDFYASISPYLEKISHAGSWQEIVVNMRNPISFKTFFATYAESDLITKRITEISSVFKTKYGIGSIYNIFSDSDPIIPKLGIIFQRWKIVLEKMTYEKIGTYATLYSIDKLLDILQKIIFHRIQHLVTTFVDAIKLDNMAYMVENYEMDLSSISDPIYSLIINAANDPCCFLFQKQIDLSLIDYNIIDKIATTYG